MPEQQVDPYIDFDQPSAEDKRDVPVRVRSPMKRTGVRNKGGEERVNMISGECPWR